MKNSLRRRISKAISALTAVTMITGASCTAITADGITKTATLNNAQISFNGGTVQTVQTYLVDGYNYIRAVDISNGLDIMIQSVDDAFASGKGISFTPTASVGEAAVLDALTQLTVSVEMSEYLVLYDSVETYAHGFELEGEQFFMLQDIEHAANRATFLVQCDYEYAQWNDSEIVPQVYLVNDIKVIWDEETGIININSISLDLAQETYRRNETNSTDLTNLKDLA